MQHDTATENDNTDKEDRTAATKERDPKDDKSRNASFPIIVIGASAGGMEAIRELVSYLPPDIGAAICIVWHMSPDVRGILPDVLNRANTIYAAHAYDGEPLMKNRIYVAPPDHHLLIEGNYLRTSRGPKENRFRPAVDPLFRSAAYSCGARVIGIVLSGALDDGTAGLWTIKDRGGLAIVQDPQEAEVSSMPENAARYVKIDYSVPVSQMPNLLISLAKEMISNTVSNSMTEEDKVKTEVSIAADKNPLSVDVMELGELSPFTCPECHGVLTAIREGSLKRYRCHTGHAFSIDSLLSSLTENIEDSLWNAIRSMKESTMLLNHIGDHFAEINEKELAALYFKKALEAGQRAQKVREVVMKHEQLTEESVRQEAEEGKEM